MTEQDAKIAGIAHERGKGIIIVVNKWDAIEKNDKTMREYENKIRQVLSFMPYAEIMYVSAETGQRLPKMFDVIDMVMENQTLRIATGVLNEIMTEAVAMQQPPSDKGKTIEALLYDTGSDQAADICNICERQRTDAFLLYQISGEPRSEKHLAFRGTALKFFIRERKRRRDRVTMERLICLVIGYAFGLIQTGYLYGKSQHLDIRKYGSGNAGTTNVLRTLGCKAGVITLLGRLVQMCHCSSVSPLDFWKDTCRYHPGYLLCIPVWESVLGSQLSILYEF